MQQNADGGAAMRPLIAAGHPAMLAIDELHRIE